MAEILFILITFLILIAILWMFIRKADLQFRYQRRLQRKPSSPGDFWKFSWNDGQARQDRWKAFLLFPMLFPIAMDDKKEELLAIKKSVKRIHIGIYSMMILLVILAIYSEKVFPN